MAYTILFASDTHLGYSTRCRTHSSGLNQRVVDGYQAWKNTVDAAIENDVDVVIHGGDLFHRSWPTISDIVYAKRQLARLSEAGIPVFGTTGNHDAAAERSKSPATAAVHDPDRGIVFVTDPVAELHPVDGLSLHVLSHYALARAERIIPEPTEGNVNILVAHGAAMVPDHPVFKCTDSPGEQPIGVDVLTAGWDISLLGHYHGRGPLPGLGKDGSGQAWYAGSSLRRGFSDPAGGRGALLVQVQDDGAITVSEVDIWQRPQFDFDALDATGMTGADLHDLIAERLTTTDIDGAIIRQQIRNITSEQRASMGLPDLARLAEQALVWQPVLTRPDAVIGGADSPVESLATAAAADLPAAFTTWVPTWASARDLPEAIVEHVAEHGHGMLKATHTDADMIADLPAAATPPPAADLVADTAAAPALADETVALDDPFALPEEMSA